MQVKRGAMASLFTYREKHKEKRGPYGPRSLLDTQQDTRGYPSRYP